MSIMVSTRFTSFLLILILLPLRFSSGQVEKSVVLATSGSGTATSSMHVEVYDGVPVVTEIDQRKMLGPGRKMMTSGLSKEIKSVEHENSEAYSVQGKKENLNVNRKLSRRGGDSVQVKMPGFVSLNADYHVPRPHPPKNN